MKKSNSFLLLILLGNYLLPSDIIADDSNIANLKNIKISIDIGKETIVYSADDLHCTENSKYGKMDVPDAPVRVVRMQDGQVVAFSGHYNNLVFHDVDFNHFKRTSCLSSLQSAEDPDPSHFSNHEWVLAPYTPDGYTIFSLVHNEHWGALYNIPCKLRLGFLAPWDSICLYANLASASSNDGGLTFKRPSFENRVVASIQYPFSSDMNRAGVRDPSNIFFNPNDKKIYFLATVDEYLQQKPGMCLFQIDNINNPVWHVWDGHDFTHAMGNPYNNIKDLQPVVCQPVINNIWVTSVVYHQDSGLFIGIGNDERAKGIFFVTSKDLKTWSEPTNIYITKSSINRWKEGDPELITYTSLIDESSPSLNFDTVSKSAFLYFVRIRISNGKIVSRERDIVKIKININYS
jgi:hypothetical protein